MKILFIQSSIFGKQGNSSRLGQMIVEELQSRFPQAELIERDLHTNPVSVMDIHAIQALSTPSEERTTEQAKLVAEHDALIDELKAADHIVLAVPMYNFGLPVQCKAWLDALARVGVTFHYTANGPEGLILGKKMYLALARGGIYKDTPKDSQIAYLRSFLEFIGITDVQAIFAEGLKISTDYEKLSFAQAEHDIHALV